jgi:thioredoxin 1
MLKYLIALIMIFSVFTGSHADVLEVNPGQNAEESSVQHWNDSNFDDAISNGIVVVDFYADWCPPCRKFGPIFEEVAGELDGSAVFGKVNVNGGKKSASKLGVSNIPTIIIFKDGKEVKRGNGGSDADTFRAWVESSF